MMGKAGGSMGEARIFTIRQCPDCMCDLPHISGLTGTCAGVNGRSPRIGTIIRKYFPKDGATSRDLTKAWYSRQHPSQHLLIARRAPRKVRQLQNRRISVAKQRNGRCFNGSESVPKDTKPKGFPT